VSALIAAYRMQLALAWRTPNYWMTQATTPVQVVLFLSIVDAFDRPDLLAHALLAPALMTMWATAVWTGGSVIRNDRWGGLIELHVAAPRSYWWVVVARVGAVVTLSLLVVPIAVLTAWVTYGVGVDVAHPQRLAVALLATAGAIVATATVLSSFTILSRAAITFQNSASYPVLLLGGVFVPVALLPGWAQPLGRLVFLSWGSDAIRQTISEPSLDGISGRLAAVVVLGGLTLYGGSRLVRSILFRVRVSGEIGVA
jgi:ABC-2 type transport system permease protein